MQVTQKKMSGTRGPQLCRREGAGEATRLPEREMRVERKRSVAGTRIAARREATGGWQCSRGGEVRGTLEGVVTSYDKG